MPTSSPSALEHFLGKILTPSELRSKEWRLVEAQFRERAMFMASVDQANILQEHRDAMAKVLDGSWSPGDAREHLRRFLEASGYKAQPGLEGTIKDLTSYARRKVSIDTNVALADGWKQRQEVLHDEFNPGWELFRAGQARAPRDWDSRWAEAAAAVNWQGVAQGPEKIALVSSPIWRELSAFDQPYPPFDYGSHMRVRPVDFERCMELGLVSGDDFGKTAADAEEESLNANTELPADRWDEETQAKLAEQLGGLAEWKDGVLRMTDLNGTRPFTSEDFARVLGKPVPKGTPSLQREALLEWMRDNGQFFGDDGEAGLDMREDLARAFNRLKPTEEKRDLFRGINLPSEEALEEFDAAVREDGNTYKPQQGRIAEAWTDNLDAAAEYAGERPYQVILRCVKSRSARDLTPLYTALQGEAPEEAELVFLGDTRFRVLRKHEVRHNNLVRFEYEVEELTD